MNAKLTRLAAYMMPMIFVAVSGCDPNAKANANDRTIFSKDRLSKEHESCSATSDCAEELRCLENTCQSLDVSVVGDYYAAVGARDLATGNVQAAIEAYTEAVNRYKADGKSVPTALYCAHGTAMVAAADEAELAEGAARALDQCLRKAPVGSSLRQKALKQLAILGLSGLDPNHLGSGEPPPRYMTKEAARPSTDKLTVKASGDLRKKARSYSEFLARIESPASKANLIPCWEMSFKATKETSLSVSVPFRNRFIEGEYEEDDGFKLAAQGEAPTAGSAQRCVYDALAGLVDPSKTTKIGPAWAAKITVTLSL